LSRSKTTTIKLRFGPWHHYGLSNGKLIDTLLPERRFIKEEEPTTEVALRRPQEGLYVVLAGFTLDHEGRHPCLFEPTRLLDLDRWSGLMLDGGVLIPDKHEKAMQKSQLR
jgi:hypothetical protein